MLRLSFRGGRHFVAERQEDAQRAGLADASWSRHANLVYLTRFLFARLLP